MSWEGKVVVDGVREGYRLIVRLAERTLNTCSKSGDGPSTMRMKICSGWQDVEHDSKYATHLILDKFFASEPSTMLGLSVNG